MKKNKKGISIVTLVISIIVMVILATVAIINLSETSIVQRAKEAKFKQNLENYITELSMYAKSKKEVDSTFDEKTINATDTTISTYITTIIEEDIEKFAVIGGNVVYKGNNPDEANWCETLGIGSISGYDTLNQVNAPKLAEGMIPVRYDESLASWVKADKTNANNDWYKYDDVQRKWANIVTVKADGTKTRKYYLAAPNGTPIAMEDVTTMFVWIPRYAYSINEGYYKIADALSEEDERSNQKIDISFLVGTTNSSFDGATYTTYDTDYIADSVWPGEATPKIVHPAFKFGDDILTGIWVAKFEASGSTDTPEDYASYPGNVSNGVDAPAITDKTYLTVLPNVPSWRSISIGDAQYYSLAITEDVNNAYGLINVDTHLIKSIDWGAVVYLSASKYGKIPMVNGSGTITGIIAHDILTGYKGKTDAYNTVEGGKASTTHNIYGVYDMNGGAWERVAGYLDNGNASLSQWAPQYFENNKLKSEYIKYWDKYDVSQEEKSNKIQVEDLGDGITEVTQAQLEVLSKNINNSIVYTSKWNKTRYRLQEKIYVLMTFHKGDALYEMIERVSYYGAVYNAKSGNWSMSNLVEPESTSESWPTTWNNDYLTYKSLTCPFVCRGGRFDMGSSTGMLYTVFHTGAIYSTGAFRPTCIVY